MVSWLLLGLKQATFTFEPVTGRLANDGGGGVESHSLSLAASDANSVLIELFDDAFAAGELAAGQLASGEC